MLHLIPKPVHRFLLKQAHRVRLVWWRLARPRTFDCRVVALDGEDRVLLVRHSYGHGRWMLPGGRPDRGETPVAAGTRELREETGCALTDAREVQNPDPAGRHVGYVIVGRLRGTPKVDGREIVEARLCAIDALSKPHDPRLPGRLGWWIKRWRAGG